MQAVRVSVHSEDGAWWAESPDVPGWSACADTRAQLESLLAEAGKYAFSNRQYVICDGIVPSAVYTS